MGFTPAMVDAMSLWEFAACCDGWARAHDGGGKTAAAPMSAERMRELGIVGV